MGISKGCLIPPSFAASYQLWRHQWRLFYPLIWTVQTRSGRDEFFPGLSAAPHSFCADPKTLNVF